MHTHNPLARERAHTHAHARTRARAHTHTHSGCVPLLLRELCYISAITVVNPVVTRLAESGGGGAARGSAAAFAVGAAAGFISAPFQVAEARSSLAEARI